MKDKHHNNHSHHNDCENYNVYIAFDVTKNNASYSVISPFLI